MDHPDHPADPVAIAPASPQDLVKHFRGYEGQLPEAVRRPWSRQAPPSFQR